MKIYEVFAYSLVYGPRNFQQFKVKYQLNVSLHNMINRNDLFVKIQYHWGFFKDMIIANLLFIYLVLG